MNAPSETEENTPRTHGPARLQPNVAFIGGGQTPIVSTVRYDWDGTVLTCGRSRGLIIMNIFWAVLFGPPVLYGIFGFEHVQSISWTVFGFFFTLPFLAIGVVSTILLIGMLFSRTSVRSDFAHGSIIFRKRFFRGWEERYNLADIASFFLHDTTRRNDGYMPIDDAQSFDPKLSPRFGGRPNQTDDPNYTEVWCLQMQFKGGQEIRVFQTADKKIATEIIEILHGQFKQARGPDSPPLAIRVHARMGI